MADKQVNIIYKVIDQSKQVLDGIQKNTSSLIDKLKKMSVVSFAGIIAAIAGVGYSLKKVIEAGIESELAITKLNSAMANAGTYSKEASDKAIQFANSMQKITKYDDEAIIRTEALLVSLAGLKDKGLEAATKATTDLATRLGMDLEEAGRTVAKTIGSNTNALARYGVQVEGAAGSQERLNSFLEQSSKLFGGAAAAEMNTMSGSLAKLKNSWDDLLESIGGKGSERLKPIVDFFSTMFFWLSEKIPVAINSVSKVFSGFTNLISTVFGGLFRDVSLVFSKIVNLFNGGNGSFSNFLKEDLARTIKLVEVFAVIIRGIYEGISAFASLIIQQFKGNFNLLANLIGGLKQVLTGNVKEGISQMGDAFSKWRDDQKNAEKRFVDSIVAIKDLEFQKTQDRTKKEEQLYKNKEKTKTKITQEELDAREKAEKEYTDKVKAEYEVMLNKLRQTQKVTKEDEIKLLEELKTKHQGHAATIIEINNQISKLKGDLFQEEIKETEEKNKILEQEEQRYEEIVAGGKLEYYKLTVDQKKLIEQQFQNALITNGIDITRLDKDELQKRLKNFVDNTESKKTIAKQERDYYVDLGYGLATDMEGTLKNISGQAVKGSATIVADGLSGILGSTAAGFAAGGIGGLVVGGINMLLTSIFGSQPVKTTAEYAQEAFDSMVNNTNKALDRIGKKQSAQEKVLDLLKAIEKRSPTATITAGQAKAFGLKEGITIQQAIKDMTVAIKTTAEERLKVTEKGLSDAQKANYIYQNLEKIIDEIKGTAEYQKALADNFKTDAYVVDRLLQEKTGVSQEWLWKNEYILWALKSVASGTAKLEDILKDERYKEVSGKVTDALNELTQATAENTTAMMDAEMASQAFAGGGVVLGSGGVDSVTAKVTPGEAVLTNEKKIALVDAVAMGQYQLAQSKQNIINSTLQSTEAVTGIKEVIILTDDGTQLAKGVYRVQNDLISKGVLTKR